MKEPEPKESRTPAIAGLVIAVVLLVVGLWLARELTAADLARLNGYVTVTLSKSGLAQDRLMRELERAIHSKRIGSQDAAGRTG